eukprot:CAMPEP_0202716792 /NCGR_PEP_ID=MMETSP1385-20130828/104976_1 /ASSEMBLY_ACC=CAM_ASM_000861 /TAXON_ID=933848 /ORGANISM="Elphidium margaritaceum" /LENGTH=48 /DNA_ID= /DNA_START= /DNA_END= /DNA_ORIENTATION=
MKLSRMEIQHVIVDAIIAVPDLRIALDTKQQFLLVRIHTAIVLLLLLL